MRNTLLAIAAIVAAPALAYKPAPAPLMTDWGARMTPENAWRAYPRPQMVRPLWTCLNGLWQYAVTSVTNTPGRPVKWDGEILVPFVPESALSGVGRQIAPDELLWYTRRISCSPRKGERILLHFDGVDFLAQVYIGHAEVTDVPHAGAQEPFTLDITPYVKAGENELTVCVWDPTDDFIQSRGKQSLKPRGCFYTRASGIWQSVWMETVPESRIEDYSVAVDLEGSAVSFGFKVVGPRVGDVFLDVFEDGRKVASAAFNPDVGGKVAMPAGFRRWTPEEPFLYTFKARYGRDSVDGYFAMRSFAVKKDSKGVLRFHLNGQPYFAIGTLDQGWWPDGLLTPPSDEAMAHDISTLKKCGFNMMRKHIKVEPRRYYHLCDTLGLLVFQDMPSGNDSSRTPMGSDVMKRYGFYRHELKAMLDNLMKVPSIVAWVPYNEGWTQPGEHLTHATLDFVRRYDPTRPVDGPSGAWDWEGGHLLPNGWAWTNRVETAHRPAGECEASDMVDMHLYRSPAMFAVNDRRASFLGEFGGLGHVVSNHLWKVSSTWGYGGLADTATPKGLENAYLGLMEKLAGLAAQGLAGSVYTQTTDVEIEINGLMTYDRKVLKFDPKVLSAAHRKIIEAAGR